MDITDVYIRLRDTFEKATNYGRDKDYDVDMFFVDVTVQDWSKLNWNSEGLAIFTSGVILLVRDVLFYEYFGPVGAFVIVGELIDWANKKFKEV